MSDNAHQKTVSGPSWEQVYAQCRLAECGVALDVFMSNPRKVLAQYGQLDAPETIAHEFRPLLPRQAAVARRLRLQEHGAEGTNSKVLPFRGKSRH